MAYLNIGGGNFKRSYWLNMDYPFDSYKHKRKFEMIDVTHDLMSNKPFKLATGSIHGVYSSHTIEHIDLKSARVMLSESHRVMKLKSYLRICCPDFDLLYKRYKEGNKKFFNAMKGSPVQGKPIIVQFLNQFTLCIDYEQAERILEEFNQRQAATLIDKLPLRKKYRPNDHISWWNEARLRKELTAAGFRNIQRSKPQQSACKAFRFNGVDKTAPERSIYMECIK